jgi:hypothetical protein
MIRALLGAYGKSATDLGRVLRITAQAASAKLRCERRFTDGELVVVAGYFGVTVEQLKSGDPLTLLGVAIGSTSIRYYYGTPGSQAA